MKLIRILLHVFFLAFILALGILLCWEQLPGNKNICDAGQLYYVLSWLVFVLVSIALIIYSSTLLKKQYWRKLAKSTIYICVIVLFVSLSLRWFIIETSYSVEKYTIESTQESFQLATIHLYENGKFLGWTYDMSCQKEHVGTYKIAGDELLLSFTNEMPKNLGSVYNIKGNTLTCIKQCEAKDNISLVLLTHNSSK